MTQNTAPLLGSATFRPLRFWLHFFPLIIKVEAVFQRVKCRLWKMKWFICCWAQRKVWNYSTITYRIRKVEWCRPVVLVLGRRWEADRGGSEWPRAGRAAQDTGRRELRYKALSPKTKAASVLQVDYSSIIVDTWRASAIFVGIHSMYNEINILKCTVW